VTAAYNLSSIVSFTVITCCTCGIAFGVDADVRRRWIDDGTRFYCPNGHDQHYTETTVQRLQKELEAQKKATQDERRAREFAQTNAAAERAAREHTQRQLATRKSINTRLRNRIRCGVCPCCRRNFENLQRHMKTQHPHFASDDGQS
jgi:hypothetical protein